MKLVNNSLLVFPEALKFFLWPLTKHNLESILPFLREVQYWLTCAVCVNRTKLINNSLRVFQEALKFFLWPLTKHTSGKHSAMFERGTILTDVCCMCSGVEGRENIGFCTGRRKQVFPCLQAVEISQKSYRWLRRNLSQKSNSFEE
jgi:hypothetical protein